MVKSLCAFFMIVLGAVLMFSDFAVSMRSEGAATEQSYIKSLLVKSGGEFDGEEPIREDLSPAVATNSGIGQVPYYTNILKDYDNIAVSEFLSLDRGNKWVYKIESDGTVREEAQSVLSISQDGWSMFDSFFGMKDIAMKVDPSGNIFILSPYGAQTFYTPNVEKDFKKAPFLTPAGKFTDLMVVTIPRNGDFWFRDVYARGVGLIYHEHVSPKGHARYSLVKAEVRGKVYP